MAGRPGPEPTELGTEERAGILDLLRKGFGINMALSELRIGRTRFDRARRADPEFRVQVAQAVETAHEQLVALRFAAALEGEARAQEFLINRRDRALEFARNMRLRARELKGRGQAADGVFEAFAQFLGSLRETGSADRGGRADGGSDRD